MILTILCYLERNHQYLMLHRVSKKNDMNKDKWIGVGGKFLPGEAPEECLLREVKEETGYTLDSYDYRGILTFINDSYPTEYIFVYTSKEFSGTPIECDEGVLEWVDKDKVFDLNLWEGDKEMFCLLNTCDAPFSLKLCYEKDQLKEIKRF